MEIVQTMNSDPGLAVGKTYFFYVEYQSPKYTMFLRKKLSLNINNVLITLSVVRLHCLQWSGLRGHISRKYSD